MKEKKDRNFGRKMEMREMRGRDFGGRAEMQEKKDRNFRSRMEVQGQEKEKFGKVEKVPHSTMLRVEGLSHSFGDKTVLKQVSFSVGQGEIVGLLGPSGAGKTTLVNLLTGQLAPQSGRIWMEGLDGKGQIEAYGSQSELMWMEGEGNDRNRKEGCTPGYSGAYGQKKKEERKIGKEKAKHKGEETAGGVWDIGIMMDHFGLYERLSVWDNLKIFASLYQVPEERIDFLLEKAELFSEKKTLVGKLSKGMRSRVNFCRALLKEAKILFLDEPTSGLDPATTKKIHELILEQKNSGATVFLTTHNMGEAKQLCDSILLLHDGKIVERGKPEELCRKYNLENKITVILQDGRRQVLQNDGEGAALLAGWMRAGELASVHSSEPDLEQVFLQLTGKELNV